MDGDFISSLGPPMDGEGPGWWFLFVEDELLVEHAGERAEIPKANEPGELGVEVVERLHLGTLAGEPCYAAAVKEGAGLPESFGRHGLRSLYGRLDDRLFALAGRALQIVEWERTHRFCGTCGGPTEAMADERARRCARCGALHFPRISPVIIVRIDRGERTLLAHGVGFPGEMYSVLAGFVEPGESLEEAVVREVREEVGIEVTDLRYFASQPWPFPHSLMIGFTARHAAGEIHVDGKEIEAAGWFRANELPSIPPPLSISRWLIDDFLSTRDRLTSTDQAPGHRPGV